MIQGAAAAACFLGNLCLHPPKEVGRHPPAHAWHTTRLLAASGIP